MNGNERSGDPLLELGESLLNDREPLKLEIILVIRAQSVELALNVTDIRRRAVRQMRRFLMDWRERRSLSPDGAAQIDLLEWRFRRRDRDFLDELSLLFDEDADSLRTPEGGRCLPLNEARLRRVLALLADRPFTLLREKKKTQLSGIRAGELPLVCLVTGSVREIRAQITLEGPVRALTRDGRYVLWQNEIWAPTEKQRALLDRVGGALEEDGAAFLYRGHDVSRFLNAVLPLLYDAMAVSLDGQLVSQLRRFKLRAKIYLDRRGADVEARVRYLYDKYEINPFAPDPDGVLLYRDALAEAEIMRCLSEAGFHVLGGEAVLHDTEGIWYLMHEGAARLEGHAEVFMSRDFLDMKPRPPRLSARMTAREGRIHFEMLDGGRPIEELYPLMRAIYERQHYFRLRTGEFLELTGLENWTELARALTEDAQADRAAQAEDTRPLTAFRASYFKHLMEETGLPLEADGQTEEMTGFRYQAPPAAVEELKPYQAVGYQWLMTLDHLRMGGILADEMGLGKTVETIAAIERVNALEQDCAPSLIVAPTSLLFNWASEFARFAPSLRVQIIQGSQADRETLYRAEEGPKPQVIITSYPLLRRDIDQAAGLEFRFAVLDEAQQIKNTQSITARAVKRLKARTRIALTGTPLENHVGELWSLMDFCLPGYLPGYAAFLRRYDEEGDLEDLRRRIRPFLLRRVKEDVLAELPERIEQTLYAEMTEAQKKVYDAVVWQCRSRVQRAIRERGFDRSQVEILSAMTQLREICCHPALCMDGYIEGSGKEDLFIDVVLPAIGAGHRVLVFSQFTRMLSLLEQRLHAESVSTLYLDGATPTRERLELTERFNDGEGQVFLISLKAGGTGLNLTGADMVIHYDPWWNPTAQEQATSRAHRLGQTRPVTVLNLVTHGTIEEQVVRLGERKKSLFDRLITPGETLPDALSKEEVMALFGV